MSKRTLLIIGATSIIAQEYAKLALANNYEIILAARNKEQTDTIASDLSLRFATNVKTLIFDAQHNLTPLINFIQEFPGELDIVLMQAVMMRNEDLNYEIIDAMLAVNVNSITKAIYTYWQRKQKNKNILYISSFAAVRGRAKNSLYGASKVFVETYLQGLKQEASSQDKITIARLGYIDTKQTYALKSIIKKAPPKDCARSLFLAAQKGKFKIYYPFFWRFIMGAIKCMPNFVLNRYNL